MTNSLSFRAVRRLPRGASATKGGIAGLPVEGLLPNVVAVAAVVALVGLTAALLHAQSSAGRCAPIDTTAKWYAKQRQWADDSKHTWSNDSLRTALIHAAGLDANPNAGTGALLGYGILDAVQERSAREQLTSSAGPGSGQGLGGPGSFRIWRRQWGSGR